MLDSADIYAVSSPTVVGIEALINEKTRALGCCCYRTENPLLCTSAMSRNFGDESGLAPNVETNTQLETAQFREILIKIGAKNNECVRKFAEICEKS